MSSLGVVWAGVVLSISGVSPLASHYLTGYTSTTSSGREARLNWPKAIPPEAIDGGQ